VGDVCEEVDACWDTRVRLHVLLVGDVCEEINGWDAESKMYGFQIMGRSGRGEKGCM